MNCNDDSAVSRLGQVVSHAKLVDMDWSFGVTACKYVCMNE